jgi:Cu(I)/Ag(I) efflux system protein CusF
MKRLLMTVLVCTAFGAGIPVYAYDVHHAEAETQKSYVVKGKVITVDKNAGKVKLKHEAVPELNWPTMTMFFSVADKSQLDALNVGDQVEFQTMKNKSDAPLITQIKVMK